MSGQIGGDAWLDRYSRQIMLEQIGYAGQERLAASSALVVGAGGLGTVVLERLAGMGVGRVVVVDRDVIEESNLHRQTLYGDADVGRSKAAVAAERMAGINGGITVEPVAASLSSDNAAGLLGGCGVAIDALDTAGARYVLNSACIEAGVPMVSGSAVGTEGQALTILPGRTACYRCVFGEVDDAAMPKCSTAGVHPSILSIVGGVEASEAVSVLTGREPALAGKMLHARLDTMEFAKMGVVADPACPACGSGRGAATKAAECEDGRSRCRSHGGIVVEELCGRGRGKRTFAVSGCGCGSASGGAVQAADGAAKRLEAMGMRVVRRGGGEIAGEGAGGVRISMVGPSCAIVVGADSADDARGLYARAAGGAHGAGANVPRPQGRVHTE